MRPSRSIRPPQIREGDPDLIPRRPAFVPCLILAFGLGAPPAVAAVEGLADVQTSRDGVTFVLSAPEGSGRIVRAEGRAARARGGWNRFHPGTRGVVSSGSLRLGGDTTRRRRGSLGRIDRSRSRFASTEGERERNCRSMGLRSRRSKWRRLRGSETSEPSPSLGLP